MSKESGDDFEIFLRAIDESKERSEKEALFIDELRNRLIGKGVLFANDLNTGSTQGILNEMQLRSLASIILMYKAAEDSSPELADQFELKKWLQAQTLAYGLDPEWLKVIDEILPGASLAEGDEELIVELATDIFSGKEETKRKRIEVTESMCNFLLERGVVIESDEEEIVIVKLAFCKLSLEVSDIPPENILERARAILIDAELTDPAWYELLEHFLKGVDSSPEQA